jgi:hypothetical protein
MRGLASKAVTEPVGATPDPSRSLASLLRVELLGNADHPGVRLRRGAIVFSNMRGEIARCNGIEVTLVGHFFARFD